LRSGSGSVDDSSFLALSYKILKQLLGKAFASQLGKHPA
jgi:hypothetical protein